MKKFENFCRALDNLTEIERYHPPYDTVVLTGLVALYQICFEQAWKAMKETLEQSGIETAASGSPRTIIKEAYRLGMIHDEDAWLNALVARNHASHAYNEAIALEVIEQTQAIFLPLFQNLRQTIEQDWQA